MGKYTITTRGGRRVSLHRAIWQDHYGPIPDGMEIDHINGDARDNRIENLRLVTPSENQRNAKIRKDNKSGVPGVFKDGKAWRARFRLKGKMYYLGSHDDWFDAVCARMSANNRYGFHENHGRR